MKIDIRSVLENKLSPAEQETKTSDPAESVATESSEIDNTSAIDNATSSSDEATRITADTASDSGSEQAKHIADSQVEPAEPEIADDADASDSSSEQAEPTLDNNSESADILKSESVDDVTDSASEQAEPVADSEAEAESAANSDLAAEDGEKAAGDFAEADAETEAPAGTFKIWLNKYGSLVAIATAMVALLAVMFAYTTMIPRTVYAEIDGSKTKIVTKEHTVEGFIADEGISYCEDDFISTPLTGFIYDGMEFEVKHATNFKVTVDGRTIWFKSLEKTVGAALEDNGVNVRKRDIVTPERDALLEENMKVVVQRVETEEITVKEKVPFKTVKKNDSSMAEGEKKVITEGQQGKDKVTYEVMYIDGEEASRKELSRENIKPAANEVVAVGTKVKFNDKLYSRKLVVKAYSYTGGGTTAMGTRARVGEIAVDPSVIPLGTNVYIPGVGARRAEDTGGNIKGNTIDIYMNTQSECINWGVRYITIYIE